MSEQAFFVGRPPTRAPALRVACPLLGMPVWRRGVFGAPMPQAPTGRIARLLDLGVLVDLMADGGLPWSDVVVVPMRVRGLAAPPVEAPLALGARPRVRLVRR